MVTMDNMLGMLVMMGFTLIFVTLGAMLYVVLSPSSKLFWTVIIVFGVLWTVGIFGIQSWCIDMGWIVPCDGPMCNLSKVI